MCSKLAPGVLRYEEGKRVARRGRKQLFSLKGRGGGENGQILTATMREREGKEGKLQVRKVIRVFFSFFFLTCVIVEVFLCSRNGGRKWG